MAKPNLTRKEFLERAALGGMALTLPSCATGKRQGPGRRPNFLVILTDDQAFRAIGYNNPVVQTPHLDQLAREGVIFDRAYIATPICAASRASLLTGVFPQQHESVGLDSAGFHKNVVQERRYPSLAQTLSDAGYDTAFCGKSHLGPPRDYGFALGQENKELGDEPSFAFATEFLEDRKANDTPFLLWVATHQPHIPLRPEPEWLARYADADIQVDPNFLESPPRRSEFNQGLPGEHFYREYQDDPNYAGLRSGPPRTREQTVEFLRVYYAVISRLDRQVGELVDTLKACGQYENTVMAFLSDNGYFLGNHGLGNKITMHEESVRVPMFIHWPGLAGKGVRSQALVSSLDLYPTFLDLAGIAPVDHLEGRSLTPLFAHPRRQLRKYVASECVGVGGKLGMGHRMVRTEQWKYILTDTNEEVLYSEVEDPYEMHNVASQEGVKTTLGRMGNYMRAWMHETGDTHQPPP